VTVDGDVDLTATSGNIVGHQRMQITGHLSADTSADLLLKSSDNDFNTLSISAQNASIAELNSLTLNNASVLGNLTVTAGNSIFDAGDLLVGGKGTFKADNEIDLGSWGLVEETRFGQLAVSGLTQIRAKKVRVIEEDSMLIAMAAADDLTLISEAGSMASNLGVTLDVKDNLSLEVQSTHNIGAANNPIDFTFAGDYSSSTLSLKGADAYLTAQASLLSGQLNTSGSSVLFRSALTDTALSASMVDFLNYLFGADDALFNEFVIIFDVKSDGVKLPEDQQDDIFAYLDKGGRTVGYVRQTEKFKQLFDLWQRYDSVFTLTVPQRDTIVAVESFAQG
ncbi:MAG: hypothetical protein KBT66_09065, partial [Amphritea sp.]|nr:hypothetical protein [Amphritea sp.]